MDSSLIAAIFVIIASCFEQAFVKNMIRAEDGRERNDMLDGLNSRGMNRFWKTRRFGETSDVGKFTRRIGSGNGDVFGHSGLGSLYRIGKYSVGMMPRFKLVGSRQIEGFGNWEENRERDNDMFDDNHIREKESDSINNWASGKHHREVDNNWYGYQPMSDMETEHTWYNKFGEQDD